MSSFTNSRLVSGAAITDIHPVRYAGTGKSDFP